MPQNKLERFCQGDRLASVLNSNHIDAENWAGNLVRLGHHLAKVVIGGESESDAGVRPSNGRLVCNKKVSVNDFTVMRLMLCSVHHLATQR